MRHRDNAINRVFSLDIAIFSLVEYGNRDIDRNGHSLSPSSSVLSPSHTHTPPLTICARAQLFLLQLHCSPQPLFQASNTMPPVHSKPKTPGSHQDKEGEPTTEQKLQQAWADRQHFVNFYKEYGFDLDPQCTQVEMKQQIREQSKKWDGETDKDPQKTLKLGNQAFTTKEFQQRVEVGLAMDGKSQDEQNKLLKDVFVPKFGKQRAQRFRKKFTAKVVTHPVSKEKITELYFLALKEKSTAGFINVRMAPIEDFFDIITDCHRDKAHRKAFATHQAIKKQGWGNISEAVCKYYISICPGCM